MSVFVIGYLLSLDMLLITTLFHLLFTRRLEKDNTTTVVSTFRRDFRKLVEAEASVEVGTSYWKNCPCLLINLSILKQVL